MSEEFYKAEVEYWHTETQRLRELLLEIANRAWHRDYTVIPPEPPVGTRYFYGKDVTWERTAKGWVCSKPACAHCPTEWLEAWQYGISADDIRVLPPER